VAAVCPLVGIVTVYLFTWHGILPFMNEHLQVGCPRWWSACGFDILHWRNLGFIPAAATGVLGVVSLGVACRSRSTVTAVEGIWALLSAVPLAFWYMGLIF